MWVIADATCITHIHIAARLVMERLGPLPRFNWFYRANTVIAGSAQLAPYVQTRTVSLSFIMGVVPDGVNRSG